MVGIFKSFFTKLNPLLGRISQSLDHENILAVRNESVVEPMNIEPNEFMMR